jgi:hypothetical protein
MWFNDLPTICVQIQNRAEFDMLGLIINKKLLENLAVAYI